MASGSTARTGRSAAGCRGTGSLLRRLTSGRLLMSPWSRYRGFSAIEVLVVGATIVLILAVLMPAMQRSRLAAERVRCLNNLNQIATAMQNYETIMGVLPPGSVNPTGPIVNDPVGYHMGWAAQITSTMDYQAIFSSIDWTYGAYSPVASAAGTAVPSSLLCVSSPDSMKALATSYAGCIGGSSRRIDVDNSGLLYLNSSIRDSQIADGRSNTLLVGEIRTSTALAGSGLTWLSGTAASLRSAGVPLDTTTDADFEIVTANAGGFGSWHEGFVSVLFADGAGKAISKDMDPQIMQQLGDRADGMILELPDPVGDRRLRNIQLRESLRKQETPE